MTEETAKTLSYAFALKVIRVVREVQGTQKEFVLSKQLMKTGTDIGANVTEAGASRTKREYTARMSLASREARESVYWLNLMKDSHLLEETQANELIGDAEELVRILNSIIKTAQSTSSRSHQSQNTKH